MLRPKNPPTEGLAHFADVESLARKDLERDVRELEQTEQTLGVVFDREAWEDAMPSADKTAHLNEVVEAPPTAHSSPIERKASVAEQAQDQGKGFSMVAGMSELKDSSFMTLSGLSRIRQLTASIACRCRMEFSFTGYRLRKNDIARAWRGELGWFFPALPAVRTLLALTFTTR